MAKKIALIINGAADASRSSFEDKLREQGLEVDVFHLADIVENPPGSFERRDGAPILPREYDMVARSIMGGVPGDTDKSLRLQRLFEERGVIPFIASNVTESVTDKITCAEKLAAAGVPIVPSVSIRLDQTVDTDAIESLRFPCIVKKNIGSGKDSLVIAHDLEEATEAVENFRNPTESKIRRGAVIQQYAPNMTEEVGKLLSVDPTSRSFHYRVIVTGDKIFGANIYYSHPGQYSMNPEQGASCHPIDVEALPADVASTALQAAQVMGSSGRINRGSGLSLAALDIRLDEHGRPAVVDMNVSPNMYLKNAAGVELMDHVARQVNAQLSRERDK